MRILLLSGTSIYPYINAAGCTTYYLLGYLAQKHLIDVLQVCPPGPVLSWPRLGPPNLEEGWLESLCSRVWSVLKEGDSIRVKFGFVEDFSDLRRALGRISFKQYDVVWAHWVNWVFFLTPDILSKTLVDYRDCFDLSYRRQLKANHNLYRRAKIIVKLILYRYFAKKYMPPANTFIMFSNADADSLKKTLPGARIEVMAPGVDIDFFSPAEKAFSYSKSRKLVFTGCMDADHNADAAIFFAKNVFPIIRNKVPKCRFQIVGRSGGKRIQELEKVVHGIEIIEDVPDIRPYLWDAEVYVAPMISGTGIKTKILEAWAAGCPVVSTALGCEALKAGNGGNILIADDPQKMAEQIIQLMNDSVLNIHLRKRGQETVREYYSWEVRARSLEKLLFRVADTGNPKKRTE